MRIELGSVAGIDGLRGIALGWVVLFHWVVLREGKHADAVIDFVTSWPALERIVRNGAVAVELFFLISGFLLMLPWFKHALEDKPAPSTREFYRRRVLRIVPAYYVQLLFLFFLVVPLIYGTGFWMRNLYFLGGNFIAHLGFLHYTSPLTSASLGLNGALWTLALEAQYYLLVPLLAPLFVRRSWSAAAAMIAVAILWHERTANGLQWLVDWNRWLGRVWDLTDEGARHFLLTQLPGYFAHFAVGILAGRAWLLARNVPSSPRRSLASSLVLVAALVALYSVYMSGSRPLGELTWLASPVLLGIAAWASVSRRLRWAVKMLEFAPLAFLGTVSYSFYLYHLPVLLLFNRYLPDAPPSAAFALYLAAMVPLAWASYRFIELPFMNRGKAKPRHG